MTKMILFDSEIIEGESERKWWDGGVGRNKR